MADAPRSPGAARVQMRASWTGRVLAYADELPDGAGEAIRGRIARATIATLEDAGPLSWLPVEVHLEVIEAIRETIGVERYRSLYRSMTLESLNRPLFGPLARAAVALFGRSAAGLERFFPRGWGLVARGCGRIRLAESRKGWARMVLEDLPPALRRTETFALGFLGAFDACVDFVRSRGESRMDTSDIAEGRVTYVLEWEE